ncbi:MAG TPA: hypothetical protein VD866_33315 [Urbifossiella sp.]|nr:hypothetical protein [Urbifossiella sp.]
MNPTEFGPDGLPLNPLPVGPEDEQATTNRLGDALGGTGDVVGGAADGIDLLGSIGDGISSAAEAVGSVASGAAEAVGSAAEGVGTAVGAAAEGCGSCSLALLLLLTSVGAAVAAVLR